MADAGLVAPAAVAHHVGPCDLVSNHFDLGNEPGRANAGDKLLALVVSAGTGRDTYHDDDALLAGGTGRILCVAVQAAFTFRTVLRNLRWDHSTIYETFRGE